MESAKRSYHQLGSFILKVIKRAILTLTSITSLLSLSAHGESSDFLKLDELAKKYRYESPDQNTKNELQKLVVETGTHYFNTYQDMELRRMNIPTTELIMAKRNLYLKKYDYALKRVDAIPKGNRLYAEALHVKATILYKQGKTEAALETYEKCVDEAGLRIGKEEGKIQNYYRFVQDSCIISKARIHYKAKNFDSAIRHYDRIEKRSIRWPYTLLENAWAHYQQDDFNRSLGLIITYESPLLESYFFPESQYLKALNYYSLCLYGDALEVIDSYYEKYLEKSRSLKQIISMNKGNRYFFDLMFTPIERSEKEHEFLRNLITQMSRRMKYSLDIASLNKIRQEIASATDKSQESRLRAMETDLIEQINHYVKVSIHQFINDIHKTSQDLFYLKLEVLSDQRQIIYEHKGQNKRARGSYEEIKRKKDQYLWTFRNAFWADELGDYTFSLKSLCPSKGE